MGSLLQVGDAESSKKILEGQLIELSLYTCIAQTNNCMESVVEGCLLQVGDAEIMEWCS